MAVHLSIVLPVIYSFQSLFLKVFTNRYETPKPENTSSVFSITYGLFTAVVTLILMGFRFQPSPSTLVFGCLNAVTLMIYNEAMIQCARRGSYSFQMVINLFGGILVPLVVSAMFYGEVLSFMQWAGILLILVSVVVMNANDLKKMQGNKFYYVWCAVLFLVNGLYSVWMDAQQRAVMNSQRNEMIVLTFGGMALLSLVRQTLTDRSMLAHPFHLQKKAAPFLVACCTVAATAVHLMLFALSIVQPTILYAINNGGVLVLSVLYSSVFFGERLKTLQWAGVAMATAAIVILSI